MTLHDYGSLSRNSWALTGDQTCSSRDRDEQVAVIDIANLMLLSQTLHDGWEFAEYLDFRQSMIVGGAIFGDEIDLIAAFLSDAEHYRDLMRRYAHDDPAVRLLRQREVSAELALASTAPLSKLTWRAQLAGLPTMAMPGE